MRKMIYIANRQLIRGALSGVMVLLVMVYIFMGSLKNIDNRLVQAYTPTPTASPTCVAGNLGIPCCTGAGVVGSIFRLTNCTQTCRATSTAKCSTPTMTPAIKPTATGTACVAGNLGTSCCNSLGKTCQIYRNGDCSTSCTASCTTTACTLPTAVPTVGPTPMPGGCTCSNCSYSCVGDGTCASEYTCLKSGTTCGTTLGDVCGGTPTSVCISSCIDAPLGSPTCIATSCTAATSTSCPGGIAYKDNCGKSGCGTCNGGSGGGLTPTTPAVCNELCACAANTCAGSSCNGNCANYTCYGTKQPTAPTAPVLSSPANAAVVYSGAIPLKWVATTSWGVCPGTSTYTVCVGTNAADPCIGGTIVTDIAATTYTYTQNTAGIYYWKVGANNGSWSATVFSAIRNFSVYVNYPPTIGALTIKNASSVLVPWDASGRANICNLSFQNNAASRTVILSSTISDGNGFTDIVAANLSWNGTMYPMTLAAGAGNNRSASVTINFPAGSNVALPVPISIGASDNLISTGLLDSGNSLKVWNCNVPVSGNMYDSSAQPLGAVCSTGAGFTDLANIDMNFKTVSVGSTTVNSTQFNSYDLGNLTWGKTYTTVVNSDLAATGKMTRWIDSGGGVGTTSCGDLQTLSTAVVDPYNANPGLKVDFSATLNQDTWFQVIGGGVAAGNSISNMVPLTCANDLTGVCKAGISINSTGSVDSGLVSALTILNNSGCTLSGSGHLCHFGLSNDWGVNSNIISASEKYNYNYFYSKYFLGLGLGTTFTGDTNMSNILAVGGTGVLLINGDLNVDVDNTLAVGKFLMLVVKGKVVVSNGVTLTQGLFVADGGFYAPGAATSGLVVEGSIYSSIGDVKFNRTFLTTTLNNLYPSVVVKYRPDLLFNIPGVLLKVFSGWKQL